MALQCGDETDGRNTNKIQNPVYGQDILATLNKFRMLGTFTDAIITAGQEEFPCHRGILAASSPYFMALFSSNLREGKEARVSFSEMSPWTFKRLLEYAYSGELEITVDNAQEILGAANLLEFPVVVEACCEFLQKQLHPSNCLGIQTFAQMHCCKALEKAANKLALENFSSVVEYQEFLEINYDLLEQYISSDHIDVRKEETVYEAVIHWVKAQLEHRPKYLPRIMEHVRLPTVCLQYLEDVVERQPLVQASSECRTLVEQAKLYHETKTDQSGRRRLSMQTTTQPRPSTVAKECLVIIGGIDNYIQTGVEMYEPHKDKWSKLPDLPEMVSSNSVASVGNQIYVLGGIVDGCIVPTVWQFDATQRSWSTAQPMLTGRAWHTSTNLNNKIYIIGGIKYEGEKVPIEDIECYDVETDQWTVAGRSPFPRKQSHIAPFQQTLIEVGGTVRGDVVANTTESYLCHGSQVDYSGEQFVLSEYIRYAQIVVIDSLFFIIWEDSKQTIVMDPIKRTFRRLADMNYPHIHSGVCVLNDRIYITGGLSDSEPNSIIEMYDPEANTWTVVKAMSTPRAFHGCVSIQM